jgi:hypothetical protein
MSMYIRRNLRYGRVPSGVILGRKSWVECPELTAFDSTAALDPTNASELNEDNAAFCYLYKLFSTALG